ncbi:MAG: carboxypeptidase-like regulatory domain-containing protein [Acidobacteriota bacterium]|nr:carboxypeptidase-like regulatory domain-containing protein [Acidobacteriota bacterium]
MKKIQAFIFGIFTILFICATTANAVTWTVTKSTNSNDSVCDADCSLREAVFNADSGDTVVFSSNLVGQTISLGGSHIVITKRITIDGYLNNPNVAFISGSNTSRHFYVQENAALDLRNITLVQGNGASFDGQVGSTEGGSIYVRPDASLQLTRVAIRGNRALYSGAVSLHQGNHHFSNSSFTGNAAGNCTAIVNSNGNLYMANVTISSNHVDEETGTEWGALCNQGGNTYVRNSTIAYNRDHGGIFNGFNGYLNLGNTIVAQNTAPTAPDIRYVNGTIVSVGGNLIGNLDTVPANTFNKPNDIYGVNPLLAPTNSSLDGFPVLTHPLQAGSPARNGGLNANAVYPGTNAPLFTDARGEGFPRTADGTVDIGAFEDQSGNTSLVVTKKPDTNDLVCDIDCSLREAVHQASLNFGTDTITFAPNVFGTLTLGGTEILIKNQSVNIVGYTKANTLAISGGDASRIFNLDNSSVSISGMTLTGGKAGNPNGIGGAIIGNSSNLSLDRVMITGNEANAYPAFYMTGGTTQRITNSTISGNSAKNSVGIGIQETSLFMSNTTISFNFDSDGGTGFGALLCMSGSLNIRNSTIAFNRGAAGSNGGIQLSGCALNIGNSIVAQNLAAANPDIQLSSGSIISVGGNLIGNTNGFPAGTFNQTNDQTGVDPLLDALADNGGNVMTHSLMLNSPAINTGVNSAAVDGFNNSPLATDARGAGFSRINGTTVDKGAFESVFAPTAASVTISGRVLAPSHKGVGNARVYLTDQQGNTRSALTNPLGYYRFEDVAVGETYVLNVFSKRHVFQPQVVNVTEELSGLNFIAEQ